MKRRGARAGAILAGGLAAAWSAGAAPGQEPGGSMFERGRNIAVSERAHPEYDALGMTLGAFIAYPEVDLRITQSDNVLAAPGSAAQSDAIIALAPSALVRSRWSRHEIEASGGLVSRHYVDATDESTIDARARIDGRLDFARRLNLTGGAFWENLSESRAAASSPLGIESPVSYDVGGWRLGARKELSRTLVSARAEWRDYDFDDAPLLGGGAIDQDFRDRSDFELGGRVLYAISPDTAVLFDIAANQRDYDQAAPIPDNERDSEGYTVLVGADFDLSNLLRGKAGLGYTNQDYDGASFSSVGGLAVNAEIEWFPSELTTANVRVAREVRETGFLIASGVEAESVVMGVDHELRRNIIVSASAGWERDDYASFDRTDERLSFNLGGRHQLNRHLGWGVSYRYAEQDTSGAEPGVAYEINELGVRASLRY